MTDAVGIQVDGLTKRFRHVRAVDALSFRVEPGRVTGFLGPNGAGKTTTLRMLLGLATADEGSATFNGRRYVDIPRPATLIGASLDAATFHPGRTARAHLHLFAPAAGASRERCDELLTFIGLQDAADRRVGGFSTGMKQRLSLATALLGDPQVLILDEPTNGLDPEGIAWLRSFLRDFAASGRTVLVSSHVLSEVQQSVDDVVIIAGGKLVHESTLANLGKLARPSVLVQSPNAAGLVAAIEREGWQADALPGGAYRLHDVTGAQVGAALFAAGIEVHRLEVDAPGLEEVFLALVSGATTNQRQGVAA